MRELKKHDSCIRTPSGRFPREHAVLQSSPIHSTVLRCTETITHSGKCGGLDLLLHISSLWEKTRRKRPSHSFSCNLWFGPHYPPPLSPPLPKEEGELHLPLTSPWLLAVSDTHIDNMQRLWGIIHISVILNGMEKGVWYNLRKSLWYNVVSRVSQNAVQRVLMFNAL